MLETQHEITQRGMQAGEHPAGQVRVSSVTKSLLDWNIPPGPPEQHFSVHSGRQVGEHVGLHDPGRTTIGGGRGIL